MRKATLYIIIVLTSALIVSCSSPEYRGEPVGKDTNIEDLLSQIEPKPLAEIYFEHGNFINQQQFPPIVKATDVLENGKNWLLIDIRSPEAYESGHINGAYNIPKEEVIDFLTTSHKAAAYPKVVFICYSGQMASYVTGITRYAGFDNTYVMLYGMAGWNSRFSGVLKNGFGDRYPEMLIKTTTEPGKTSTSHEKEETAGEKLPLTKLPKLPEKLPSLLIRERAQSLLRQSRPEFLLKADEFFPSIKNNTDDYYSIFYIPKSKYYFAHIKGSKQFTPRKDLSLDGRLTEIPTDKPVVIYCKTGHTGGNATAYLNMLGYKAHNLMFGAGSFMYSFWKDKEWMRDINDVINEFPVIEGKKRTNNKVITLNSRKISAPKKPIKKRKKKEVSGGCG